MKLTQLANIHYLELIVCLANLLQRVWPPIKEPKSEAAPCSCSYFTEIHVFKSRQQNCHDCAFLLLIKKNTKAKQPKLC